MNRLTFLAALGLANCATAGTLLTFDVNSVSAGISLNQAYGDRVSAASDAFGTYGTDDSVYTPNVLVSYAGTPRVWTTGYGNLTNLFYNDDEGGTLTLTLTADPGFQVMLASFDLAAFASDHTLPNPAVTIRDGGGNLLFSLAGPVAISGSTRNSISANVSAQVLTIELSNALLGNSSDNIGLDNLLFSQQVAPDNSGVPEPGTFALVAGALTAAYAVRRRK